MRTWFADHGFAELGFDTEDGHDYAVGTHVLRVHPSEYRPGRSDVPLRVSTPRWAVCPAGASRTGTFALGTTDQCQWRSTGRQAPAEG